jgi:hypothetical protein
MDEYGEFLQSKRVLAAPCGFEVAESALNPMLKPFQRDITRWALRRGKAAVFAHTGLGKGPIQLEWCRQVSLHTGMPTLIMAPLAVSQQFKREAEKFHIPVTVCQDDSEVQPGVNVTNYERMGNFDLSQFSGVALDESSCIKDWTSKTTRNLIEKLANTPYKLCSTATPSPNDHAELGTHAELLDVMTRNQMLAMFFEHDGSDTSKWSLKGHGKAPFWKFCASWAVCLVKPSDLGYDDTEYILPKLHLEQHIVEVDHSEPTDGMLFRSPDMSATGLHKEMRLTADRRALKVGELIAQHPDEQWLIWCNTDYEATAIRKVLPGVFEVKGGHSQKIKESAIVDFLDGNIQWLLSKVSIFGFGLNLQRCRRMVFMGLSYSFESLFQAIRRCWRFGQTQEVYAHLVIAETEGPVLSAIRRKERQYEELQGEMNAAMREQQLEARHKGTRYDHTVPMEIPEWLHSQTA